MLTEEKYQRWNSGTSAWDNMYWARYAYDTAGNMVEREVNQIVNSAEKWYHDYDFVYSRGYQLTEFTRENAVETQVFTLTYDANGNMTHISQSGTFTDSFYDITEMEFQFDEKNRMTHYRFGGAGSYFQIKYDALGRVRERVDLTPTTTKYYSDGRELAQELDNSNNVVFDYFRFRHEALVPGYWLASSTGLLRQKEVNGGTTINCYIKDANSTIWALIDPLTVSVKRYNYNAWGAHLDKDDPDFPTDENAMRYISARVEGFGNSADQAHPIYHCDRRHYLPSLCMFNSRESLLLKENQLISNALTLNPYMYSDNDPVNYFDSSGLKKKPGVCCFYKWDGATVSDNIVIARWGLKIPYLSSGLCVWECKLIELVNICNPYFYEDQCPTKYEYVGLDVTTLDKESWDDKFFYDDKFWDIYILHNWQISGKDYWQNWEGRWISVLELRCNLRLNLPDNPSTPPFAHNVEGCCPPGDNSDSGGIKVFWWAPCQK